MLVFVQYCTKTILYHFSDKFVEIGLKIKFIFAIWIFPSSSILMLSVYVSVKLLHNDIKAFAVFIFDLVILSLFLLNWY